jgi:hypothetical protein
MLLAKSAWGSKHEGPKGRKNEKRHFDPLIDEFANSIQLDAVGEIGAMFETRTNEGKKKRNLDAPGPQL